MTSVAWGDIEGVERAIISRKEAKDLGLTRYFTGKPCKYGHVTERRVSNRKCVECGRGYDRQHYAENREQELERMRQWHEANREQVLERMRQWHEANRDKKREYDRQYREANREQIAEYNRQYERQRRAADPAFREARQLRAMLWRVTNGTAGEGALRHLPPSRQEDIRAKLEGDLAALRANPPKDWPPVPATYDDLLADEGWHLDHIVPVSTMLELLADESREVRAWVGSHPEMLRPMPAAENCSRAAATGGDHFDELWAKIGFERFDAIVAEARAYHPRG